MKIILSGEDKKKFKKLLETKEYNITTADLLNDLCLIRDYSLQNEFANTKLNIFNNDIIMSWAIHVLNIDISISQNQAYFKRFLSDSFILESINNYSGNSYSLYVRPKSINDNNYHFSYEHYPPYSFFPLNDISVVDDDYYREITKVGMFKEEYKFLTLFENQDIWMCITPNEINTMNKAILNAKGVVVTLGLGLGYFAYMASNKDNVSKVIVIEKNDKIINLFTTYLLPLFPSKNKIQIIHSDALNEVNLINGCDYCFCDLWHDANDGLPIYMDLKKQIKINADYWIEESLVALYRRCLITVMEESLRNNHDSDYKYASNPIDKIINQIYFKTKNVEFYDYKSIHEFCSKKNIIKLISE